MIDNAHDRLTSSSPSSSRSYRLCLSSSVACRRISSLSYLPSHPHLCPPFIMKAAMRAVKNSVLQYEPIEVMVREATSSDKWGVTDSTMQNIAEATFQHDDYPQLFAMLWKRVTDVEHVMHVQKSLILIEYLLRFGSERFILDAKRRSRDIAALQKYKHYDENNQDDGKEARMKAKIVNDLLSDDHRLQEARAAASKLRSNMKGFGSNDYNQGSNYGGEGGSKREGGRDRQGSREQDDNDRDNDYRNDRTGDRANGDDPFDTAPAPTARKSRSAAGGDDDPYGESKSSKGSAVPASAAFGDDADAAKKARKAAKRAAAQAASASPEDDPFSVATIPTSSGVISTADASPTAASTAAVSERKAAKRAAKQAAAAAASANPSASSQYAATVTRSSPAAPASSSADVDLSSFADRPQRANASNDFDFLGGGAAASNGNDLSSMFATTSIAANSQPTLWDSHTVNTENSDDDGDDGFDAFDAKPARTSHGHSSSSQQSSQPKTDIWSSDLFNLERLDQPHQSEAHHAKTSSVDGGVSMSMMKNLNPTQVATPRRSIQQVQNMQTNNMMPQQNQNQNQNNGQFNGGGGGGGAFAATGGFASSGGFNRPPPALGPQPGYGGGGNNGFQQNNNGGGYNQQQGGGGFNNNNNNNNMGYGNNQQQNQGGYNPQQGGNNNNMNNLNNFNPQVTQAGMGGGMNNSNQQSSSPFGNLGGGSNMSGGGGGGGGGGHQSRGSMSSQSSGINLDPFASLIQGKSGAPTGNVAFVVTQRK